LGRAICLRVTSVSKANALDSTAKVKFQALFEPSSEKQKINRLLLDDPLMRYISNGGKVSIYLEDWFNKSLGRTPIKIYLEDQYDREFPITYTCSSVRKLMEMLFPWGSCQVDSEFYKENCGDEFEKTSITESTQIFPYTIHDNERADYRLILKLNSLGESWLEISDYVNDTQTHIELF
jgi:hypothetical protein